ncbi:MAG: flavodoxin-dependent (E)-4-hydroxy-3-methylbut-2-enyl-diphosphate synthase [Clostridiales Family XIII bacterium]|jgi:(E)-4-hydroxy-3-methylbut-2-enyl-diphosphate synthase|nr:flavodoxin-dependent (E)-4-hydroxy-3-methylbut-2-enyl-diphosphate synthase [Clostridiales Family XIII bacterium]
MSSRSVMCGEVKIGGGGKIPVQSMTNVHTEDVYAVNRQIWQLAEAGCDIVRVAVPTEEAARAISKIKENSPLPIVADIHFDYKLAILAIEHGADKIRINPGNIGSDNRIKAVVDKAKEAGIPIRIGVNSGSVEKELIAKYGGPTPEALVESAVKKIELIESMDFDNLVLSIKSSDIKTNTAVHRLIKEKTDVPLHIGITEAGVGEMAVIKSAIGIGSLLMDGIGDTIRVSLTGDPVNEIYAAYDILRACDRLGGAINIISCPTCGRCKVNLLKVASDVSDAIKPLEKQRIKTVQNHKLESHTFNVAIMGCAVNGPGEAKHADLGIACGDGNAVLFRKGEIIETIRIEDAPKVLISNIVKLM